MGIIHKVLAEKAMDPVQRTWHWWINLIDVPLWDPWLATICVGIAVYLIVVILHKMLRP